MNLLLDVERRRLDDEIAPVLVVLAAPDELRIEVGVPWIAHLFTSEVLGFEDGLMLGGRNVQPLVVGMTERLDLLLALWRGGSLRHFSSRSPRPGLRRLAHARTPAPP